jgi:hypothetical protein
MTEGKIFDIVESYETDTEFRVSEAFPDGGIDPLFARLRRAAVDQPSGDLGALSRYGIWSNTVRDNIREAEAALDGGNLREVRRFLFRAANAMSAFAELQAQFDSAGRESQTEPSSKDD